MKNNCVFCAIAAGEIPSFKVFEDENIFAFLDINPFSKGHVLVIPKEHSANLIETSDETLSSLMVAVKKVALGVKKALGCAGFNILQNNGEAAGQTVMHIHFHIVPRYSSGPIIFENGKCEMSELEELAAKIRSSI
ncbi:MAG: HIT family protein [Kiritimatiellae bacterium]|nr:HIT family protein [Kiritimatiellia bacterium]